MSREEKLGALLPASPGIYLVHLRLDEARLLRIGRLGEFTFPAGEYFYAGSAFGPGGLRSRLGRHLRGNGKAHWHIDYLRTAAGMIEFIYQAEGQTPVRMEVHLDSTRTTAYGLVSDAISVLPAILAVKGDFSECGWFQRLAALPQAFLPVPGFGSSDCRQGCPAHLVAFPPEPYLLR